MSTNLNTAKEELAWKREELPGMPIWAVERGRLTESARLVRDGNGKTIFYEKPNSESLRTALVCRLCRCVRTVQFVTDVNAYERHPDSATSISSCISPVVAFAIDSDATLSIVERIEAKVIADMFDNYAFVNPVSESYRLPRIFAEYSRDWPGNAWSVPAKVVSEEKALQIAQLAEYILETEAEIISETDGYFSVVIPHTDRVAKGDAMIRLSHAIDLLNHFDIAAGDQCMITSIKDEQEMYDRSLYGAEVYMAQHRIEKKLDALLVRSEQSPATATETLCATNDGAAILDAPAKSARGLITHALDGKRVGKSSKNRTGKKSSTKSA